MKKGLRRGALGTCLFLFLLIVLGGALHLSTGAALLAAVTGTPLFIAGTHRLEACWLRRHEVSGRPGPSDAD